MSIRRRKFAIYIKRRSVFLSLVLISNYAAAQANSSAPDCSSPEIVLRRYVDALGGAETLQQIHTSVTEASEREPGETKKKAKFEWKAPNRVAYRGKLAPEGLPIISAIFGTATFLFDGQDWSDGFGRVSHNEDRTPLRQRKLRAEYPYDDYPQFMMARVIADPLMIARNINLYSSYAVVSSTSGFCILHASGIDLLDHPILDTLAFDPASGLLKTWSIQGGTHSLHSRVDSNIKPDPFQFQFDDYRQVDGIKTPFHIDFSFYNASFQIHKVVFNRPLSDTAFMPRK